MGDIHGAVDVVGGGVSRTTPAQRKACLRAAANWAVTQPDPATALADLLAALGLVVAELRQQCIRCKRRRPRSQFNMLTRRRAQTCQVCEQQKSAWRTRRREVRDG